MAVPLQPRQRAIYDGQQREREELILRLQDLLNDDTRLCDVVDQADQTKNPNTFLRQAINDLHASQADSPQPLVEGDSELLARHGVSVVPFYTRDWSTDRQTRQRQVIDVLAGYQLERVIDGSPLRRGPASGWNRVHGMAGAWPTRSAALRAATDYCRELDAQATAAAAPEPMAQTITLELPAQPFDGTLPMCRLSPIRLDSATATRLHAVQLALQARGEQVDGVSVVTLTLAAQWVLQQLSAIDRA
jgi:hypothetical protein